MKNSLVKSLNGMGIGLFATLVVGTIIVQLGTLIDFDLFITLGSFAKVFMGGAIGAAVAYFLEASPLVIFSCVVTGSIGAGAIKSVDGAMILGVGDPAGAYIAAILTVLLGKLVAGKTKVDILLTPIVCIIFGGIVGLGISPTISQFVGIIGDLINRATEMQPIYMGAIISTIMGLVLVSPISSAALATSLGLNGLAAGAAVVGCSCQMIGFAVISFKENGVEGLIAQGIGTAKIQFGNVVKNPYILIPTVVSSFIIGILSTTVFKITSNSIGAGMGTSGLVGQIQTVAIMGKGAIPLILISQIILPALISLIIVKFLRKKNLIKDGDMLLEKI
ncbi:PTS sugar transporter subunit IIC [Clostridium sp. LIBA-8841]|uniref:PTS transporter subunit IIC n=1 Tax=Clostridium sp. LIBA-8841 TaxID=2987530 RepID=UPI002AC3866F|nr:PTS sugar transporter subunit IIC [Clostridium sp. LIBA-8841]MDZ5252493.1 PTS sugar transporter subunit IIC [Clostridium sp. LIBA-8841]